MGPYYDHATVQARARERAARRRPNASLAIHGKRGAARSRGHVGGCGGSFLAGMLLVPGVAVACHSSGLLKLIAGEAWTLLFWRALFSASIIALAAAVSSLAG